MTKRDQATEKADFHEGLAEGKAAAQRAAQGDAGAARGEGQGARGEGDRVAGASLGKAPQAAPSGGRVARATGAAARDDAGPPEGTQRLVVAARDARGFRRGGHFFGPERAVYNVDSALAQRLKTDGLGLVQPYDPERHSEVAGMAPGDPPLTLEPVGVKPEPDLDRPFDPPMETPPRVLRPGERTESPGAGLPPGERTDE